MDDLLVMKRTNFTWAVYLKAARQVTRQNCEEISKRHKIEEADRQNQEKNANNTTYWRHKRAKKKKDNLINCNQIRRDKRFCSQEKRLRRFMPKYADDTTDEKMLPAAEWGDRRSTAI